MPVTPGIELTKDSVLKRITEEEIFERYLGYRVDEGVSFVNPLRPDQRPGCRFYTASNGRPYFHDFGKHHWDCFNVVMFKYGVSFIEALKIIVRDFNLKEISDNYTPQQRIIPVKVREEIKVAVREWTKADALFWNPGNISLEYLKQWSVYPCKAVWINNEYYRCTTNDPCYCYYFGNNLYKLYFPKRTYNRFFQNITIEDDLTQGWNKLPEYTPVLFITKSYKDVISMSTFGLVADAILSEYHLVKLEKIRLYNAMAGKIFTLFDHDQTGRRLAIKYEKIYNIPPLMFPRTWKKDWFANVALFGPNKMHEIIQIWKENLGL